jgi:hypothetical protein
MMLLINYLISYWNTWRIHWVSTYLNQHSITSTNHYFKIIE